MLNLDAMSNSGVDILKFIKLTDESGSSVIVNPSKIVCIYGDMSTIIWFGGDNATQIVKESKQEIMEMINAQIH